MSSPTKSKIGCFLQCTSPPAVLPPTPSLLLYSPFIEEMLLLQNKIAVSLELTDLGVHMADGRETGKGRKDVVQTVNPELASSSF